MSLFNFSSVYRFYDNSGYFGQGNDPILLDNLSCSGSELTLLQCSHRGLVSHNCRHSKDVGVWCSGSKTGSLLN